LRWVLLVPLLVHLGGSRLALHGVAAVLPLAAAGGRGLVTLDAEAPVPVVQIALCVRFRCSPNCQRPRSRASQWP
jgi:hypothetical protein